MLGALNMTACGHCNQILGGFRISSAAITWGPFWSFTGGSERENAISNHRLVVSMQHWQSTKIYPVRFSKTRISCIQYESYLIFVSHTYHHVWIILYNLEVLDVVLCIFSRTSHERTRTFLAAAFLLPFLGHVQFVLAAVVWWMALTCSGTYLALLPLE